MSARKTGSPLSPSFHLSPKGTPRSPGMGGGTQGPEKCPVGLEPQPSYPGHSPRCPPVSGVPHGVGLSGRQPPGSSGQNPSFFRRGNHSVPQNLGPQASLSDLMTGPPNRVGTCQRPAVWKGLLRSRLLPLARGPTGKSPRPRPKAPPSPPQHRVEPEPWLLPLPPALRLSATEV